MARKKKQTTTPTEIIKRGKTFNSLHDLAAWIDATPADASFIIEQSHSTGASVKEFTGSESYEEANDLALNGWDYGAEEVNKIMMERAENYEQVKRLTISYVGCVPCIPAYLSGSPANMIAIKKRPTNKPIITICYNSAVGYNITAEAITKAAAKLLNVIRGLEAGGAAINLFACSFSRSRDSTETETLAVKIKDSKEPFNVLNMAYPLIHPSFLRRQSFAFTERNGGKYKTWNGYGCTIRDREKMQNMSANIGINNAVCLSYYDLCDRDEKQIVELIK